MSYNRQIVTDGVTIMNKALYDNLQDGVEGIELVRDHSLKLSTVSGGVAVSKIEGSSTQSNDPSPTSLKEITSAGEKGFFDGLLRQGDFSASGKYSSASSQSVCTLSPIPCDGASNIQVSTSTLLNSITVYFYDSVGGYIKSNTVTHQTADVNSYNLTLDSSHANAKSFKVAFGKTSGVTPSTISGVSILVDNKYAIIIDKVGKNLISLGEDNLCALNNCTLREYRTEGSEPYLYLSSQTNLASMIFMCRVSVGVTYTFSVNAKYDGTDAPKIVLGNNINLTDGVYATKTIMESGSAHYAQYTHTFTATSNVLYIGFKDLDSWDGTYISNVQLEESDAFTEYSSYMGSRVYIPIGTPLYGTSDLCDEITFKDGVFGVIHRFAKKRFVGNDLSYIATVTGDVTEAIIGINDQSEYLELTEDLTSKNLVVCSIAKGVSFNEYQEKTTVTGDYTETLAFIEPQDTNNFCIRDSSAGVMGTTLAQVKAFLDNNNVYAVYRNPKPYFEEIPAKYAFQLDNLISDEGVTYLSTVDGLALLNVAHSVTPVGAQTLKALTLSRVLPKEVEAKISVAEKGVAFGVANLDAQGRIPYSELPESAMEYKGAWDASTNTPTLTQGVGTNGDFYIVSVGGTWNNIMFYANDRIIYDGATETWQRISGGGHSLSELTDVEISNPQSGDLLMYNSSGNKFGNSVNVNSLLRGTLTVTPQGPTQIPGSILLANSSVTSVLAVAQVRNIQASTTDLTAGSSALATGDIYIVYE